MTDVSSAPTRGGSPHSNRNERVSTTAAGGPSTGRGAPERERLHRKQRLAAGFRIFARCGFALGDAGHITARDPERTDCFWVNPAGLHFSRITVSDLMLVDSQGQIVEPPRVAPARLNPAAFAIHSELHKARPDVIAAAHAHSIHGLAWSSLGRLPAPLTQDAAAFFEDVALFCDFSGVVLDTSEGARIAESLGRRNAVILQNHGLLTAGASVESAVWRFVSLDSVCQIQLLAEAAGQTRPMPAEVARLTAGQLGGESACIDAFEPYWSMVVDEEPDLFD